MFNVVNGDIILSGGSSLDSYVRAAMASVNAIGDSNNLNVITDLSDIGMSISVNTLTEISRAMPVGSIVFIPVSGSGDYAGRLPLPTLSNGGTPVYFSGQITLIGDFTDPNKVYIYYHGNGGLTATALSNFNVGTPFSGWRFQQGSPLIARPAPAEFGNLISNIFVSGDYYFSGAQMSSFTDAPSGAGAGYLNVVNSTGNTTSDKMFIFTENNPTARTWKRISYSSYWVSIPTINPTPVADSSLRIGDMKISNSGDLYIRTNSTTVKAL